MRRVVEFDLVTKSEANRRGNSKIAQVIHAKEVKAQRAAVGAVLRANLTPPPLHVVKGHGDRFERVGTAIGMTERNTIAVNLTRIAPGLLDDDNINAALKHVRDEIAAWVLVPNDRDPIFRWSVPPAQEKADAGVYRVRIEIVDKLTGPDRVVRLAETRSAGVQAERRVKQAIKKATKKPTVRDLHATAERLLSPPRDPGEERSAREIALCSTCGAPLYRPCYPGKGRMIFGVHVARARAAGLHVPDDDRAKVRPARAAHGPRKLVPAARPAGQTVLPILAAWCAFPWEQGAKGRVLTRAARYDGLDDPPTTITASVPAEHVQRYGSTVTLTRQKFDSRATGPCWLYATKDERTTT